MEKIRPLGSFIFNETRKIGQEIQEKLAEISKNREEWVVYTEYNFSLSPEKKVRDFFRVELIPYIENEKQETHTFKFNSLNTIFLSEIVEVMYKIVTHPGDVEKILHAAKVDVEVVVASTF